MYHKTIIQKITCLSILGAQLSSCIYTKEYHPPSTASAAKTWETKDTHYQNAQANLPYLAWWEKFNDPTLNELMTQGLIQNNQINTAMANIEAAHGELKRVQLNWIPTLSTNFGYSSFPDLGFPGVLFAVIPSYTLNAFSQIKEQKRAAYELKASNAERDAVKLAVIGQIATSYFTYSAQIEQLQLFRQLEADLDRLVIIAQAAYHGGLTSQIDLEQAKRELNVIKAQKRVTQHNINVSQHALRYLLNENPQMIPLTKQFDQLNGNQIVIGALPLNVIDNRPDMIQATNELKASNEGIGVAFSNLLPSVQLSLARGSIGTTPNGYDFGQHIYFNQSLLQIPLLEPSVLGEIEKAKGLNKASFYRYLDTLRKILRDVNNDMSAHDFYTKRYDDTFSAKNNQQRVYDLNKDLYNDGIISHMDLLTHKVALDSLLIQVNQAKLEQFLTIVNLYQDLGGGYAANTGTLLSSPGTSRTNRGNK